MSQVLPKSQSTCDDGLFKQVEFAMSANEMTHVVDFSKPRLNVQFCSGLLASSHLPFLSLSLCLCARVCDACREQQQSVQYRERHRTGDKRPQGSGQRNQQLPYVGSGGVQQWWGQHEELSEGEKQRNHIRWKIYYMCIIINLFGGEIIVFYVAVRYIYLGNVNRLLLRWSYT